MKRLILLSVITAILMGMLSWVNCANPLEADNENPNPPIVDTVFRTDTMFVIDTLTETDTMIVTDTVIGTDTLIVIDTLIGEDTVFITDTLITEDTIFVTDTLINEDTIFVTDTLTITDTLTQVDTVIIYEPEPGEWSTVCSILLANLREIIWMFDNEAGDYVLHFTSDCSRDFEERDIIVEVDGQKVGSWRPTETNVFEIALYLDENATINIYPDKPLFLGHQVDICLSISKPRP